VGNLKEKALAFATEKHEGQVRKFTQEPYVTHSIAVADMVEEFFREHTHVRPQQYCKMIAAAILHDTVEDTDATIEEIREHFGEQIAAYVWYLTKPPEIKGIGNRAHRKKLYNAQLALAPEEVRVIKFFDAKHNAPSLKEHDPKFYRMWMRETQEMFTAINIHEVYGGALIKVGEEFLKEI